MTVPIRGEAVLLDRAQRIQLFTADGSVNVMITNLDSVPRVGETVEFGAGLLYRVEHVRWQVQVGAGMLTSGGVTARVLLAPTSDPVRA